VESEVRNSLPLFGLSLATVLAPSQDGLQEPGIACAQADAILNELKQIRQLLSRKVRVLTYQVGCLAFLLGFVASAQTISCITSTCQLSTNIAWDTIGKPIATLTPNLWGTQDLLETPITFTGVPAGYHVRILRATGDQIAGPHGAPKPNTFGYVLVGLVNTTPYQSPFVQTGLGSAGCFLYKQAGFSFSTPARIPINEKLSGDLNSDNILVLKQALFLNELGDAAPIHIETSLVISFRYVANLPAPVTSN
jgi:hypothetical protein